MLDVRPLLVFAKTKTTKAPFSIYLQSLDGNKTYPAPKAIRAPGSQVTDFFLGFHVKESWSLHYTVSDFFFLQVDSDYLDTQFGISYQ